MAGEGFVASHFRGPLLLSTLPVMSPNRTLLAGATTLLAVSSASATPSVGEAMQMDRLLGVDTR